MKKIFLFLLPICIVNLASCNFVKEGTLTVDYTSINLFNNQDARIRCFTTNGQVAKAKSSNPQVVQIYESSDYTRYNNYIYLTTFQLNPGTADITISAPGTNTVTVTVTVKEDEEYTLIQNVSLGEAIIQVDEALAKKEASIVLKNIAGLTKLEDIIDRLELNDGYASLSAYGSDESVNEWYLIFSYFDVGTDVYENKKQYKDIVNVASYLRNINRHPSRTNLPIDQIAETFQVESSEQLFLAVEHGYRPTFVDNNSNAKKCYDAARKICLEYIDDDMTAFEKVRAIYEWICEHTTYNYSVVDINENDDWSKYTDYYLEGPLLHGTGVCDGFSKTFSLLSGIEQINTIDHVNALRAFGYTSESGHAWNYAKVDNTNNYYLVCPTWGQIALDKGDRNLNPFGYDVSFTSYAPFMAKRSYFASQGEKFSDYSWPKVNRVDSTYKYGGKTPMQLDTYDGEHNYLITSQADADCLLEACRNSNLREDFAFNVIFPLSIKIDDCSKYLTDAIESKYSGLYKSYAVLHTDKAYDEYYWFYGLVHF